MIGCSISCFISAKHTSNATLKFAYDIGSRLQIFKPLDQGDLFTWLVLSRTLIVHRNVLLPMYTTMNLKMSLLVIRWSLHFKAFSLQNFCNLFVATCIASAFQMLTKRCDDVKGTNNAKLVPHHHRQLLKENSNFLIGSFPASFPLFSSLQYSF